MSDERWSTFSGVVRNAMNNKKNFQLSTGLAKKTCSKSTTKAIKQQVRNLFKGKYKGTKMTSLGQILNFSYVNLVLFKID